MSSPSAAQKEHVLSGYMWLCAWFVLNIGVTLMNKAIFQWYSFSFPIAVSCVHMVFSWIGSILVIRGTGLQLQELTMAEQVPVGLFSVLFCANIVVGNSALRYVAVSLTQVVRSSIPGITMAMSILILKKSYARAYYWVVLLIMAGVALASAGEIDFHFLGFVLTIFVCFLSATKSVVAQKFLVGKLKFHPFELLYRMSGLAALQMAILAFFMEATDIMAWWDLHSDPDSIELNGIALDSSRFAALLALNGTLAFFLNYTNFMTTQKTSALTVTVAGNVKHMCTILFSVMMFQNPISILNGIGTLVTFVGAVLYSGIDYNEKMRAKKSSLNV